MNMQNIKSSVHCVILCKKAGCCGNEDQRLVRGFQYEDGEVHPIHGSTSGKQMGGKK